MKPIKNKRGDLKTLALALALGAGLATGSAQAQTILEVAGDGAIGNEILTTDAGVAKVPTNGSNWTTPGAGGGGGNTAETFLGSPDMVVPTTGSVTLRFSHRYFFEANWDGGAVFVSVNGAAATYVPSSSFSAGTYDGTTGANPGTAWTGGEEVFTGKSLDYDSTVSNLVDSVVDLGSLTMGDTVSVEFRAIWDEGFTEEGTDWEVATVTLEDSVATPFLDVDFITDGASGFTVESNVTVNGGEWTYPLPVNTFEIDADLLTADRYAPDIAGTTTTIDLDGAALAVELLTGTIDIGDTFTLFDLSGGTTLTGSVGTLSLPPGTWDTSNLETDGTITILDTASPLIYEPFNDLDPSLSGNTPGTGLSGTWSAASNVADGSLIYGALAYQGGRAVVNPGGGNFQENGISPGTTLTDAGLMADGATLWFSALIQNYNPPAGDDRTYLALGTGVADGFDRIKTATGGNEGSGFTIAVNKVSAGGVTAQAWNDGSDGAGGATRGATVPVTDVEPFLAVGKITWGEFGTTADTFELYLPDKDLVLGAAVSTITADFDQLGTADPANAFGIISFTGGNKASLVPEVDEIRFGATYTDVTPRDLSAPVLVSTDPVDDSPSGSGTQLVATFNEEVIVGAGDDIRIVNDTDAVTTTITVPDPRIATSGNTLIITPTVPLLGGKAYHIEIDAGAVTNYNGVAWGGISSATEWNFIADGTPPTVVSIEDNVSPLPILIDSSLTYTVTFSEPMDVGTIDTTDFANGGSADITVDSVSATGDPSAFEVVVSTIAAGDLTLEIVESAVITDLTGNPLDTSSAIPDGTTIDVTNPTPTAASLVTDFQTTIASQQNANNTGSGEGRYYHVSVNPNNAGTGWYCADLPNSGTDGPSGVRNYTAPVVAYKFLGGTNGSVAGVAASGGEDTRITYATEDTVFDGFGQQQLRLWVATDPGADLATGAGTGATGFDGGGGGYRDWSGAVGTIDISGLESGSVHIYYGSYNSTPSVKVTMRDTDNVAADIVIADAHLNGDSANNGEYYLAEIDFVTDGFYDVIEYEWLSSNGRGLGTVLTGPEPLDDYTAWAALYPAADLSDPDADFDGDGRTNGYERIFGLDPTAANSLDPFTTGLFEGTTSTFAFSRRDDALTGLFTDIETSFDLEMWTADSGAVLVEGAVDGSTMIEIVEVTLSPGLLTAPKLFVRVNQNDGTILSENFETGDGGYTVATTAGTDWEHGMPDSQGFGANAVTEGNGGSMNCWGTNLGDFNGTTANTGSYADSTVTSLRSAIIDLSGAAGAELLFAEALDIEAGDTAAVYIIDDTTDTVIGGPGPIYTAVDDDDAGAGWSNVGPIAIPAAALGQPIRIEWRFTGFGGATDDYLGWYVDDVTVRETMP